MIRIRIGEEWYPVELGQIEQILPGAKVVPVPKAPPGVVGIVLYQGQAVPLHQPEAEGASGRSGRFAVLVRRSDGTFGGVLAEEIVEEFGVEGAGLDQIHG